MAFRPNTAPHLCRAPGSGETASSRRGDQLRTGRLSRARQGTSWVLVASSWVRLASFRTQ